MFHSYGICKQQWFYIKKRIIVGVILVHHHASAMLILHGVLNSVTDYFGFHGVVNDLGEGDLSACKHFMS